jgi:hypothetical protein
MYLRRSLAASMAFRGFVGSSRDIYEGLNYEESLMIEIFALVFRGLCFFFFLILAEESRDVTFTPSSKIG